MFCGPSWRRHHGSQIPLLYTKGPRGFGAPPGVVQGLVVRWRAVRLAAQESGPETTLSKRVWLVLAWADFTEKAWVS